MRSNQAANLDVLEHPVLNFIYYLVSFILFLICIFILFSWAGEILQIAVFVILSFCFILTVGGDITVVSSSFYFAEIAS